MGAFIDILRESPKSILWLYLIIVNLITYVMMGVDKRRAIKGKWRIPENRLFTFAAIGGSIGGILGIYGFRHKTKHRKFTYGFPAILVAQIALLYMVFFVL